MSSNSASDVSSLPMQMRVLCFWLKLSRASTVGGLPPTRYALVNGSVATVESSVIVTVQVTEELNTSTDMKIGMCCSV